MRYVPVGAIRENMILAKNIYGEQGQLLLNAGCKISNKYLESIISMGFSGVYIQDSLSEDIEIESIISDELRRKTIDGVKNVFISIGKNERHYDQFEELKKRIETILEEILNDDNLMINMTDLKTFDEYIYQHSVNVAVLSMLIGTSLRLSHKEMFNLGLAALLHDVGKIFVNKEVLNKPGKLDANEMEMMENHSYLGYKYLKSRYEFSISTYIGVLDHHERYDGTGYPNNKRGKDISLFGRIINVADVYDALTAERPYRSGILPSEAMEYIMGGAGSHFDPEIVEVFIRRVAPYPLGTCVRLSNGYEGIVVKNYQESSLRPSIRVYKIDGESVEPFIINLKDDKKYLSSVIIEVVKEN